MPDPGTLSIIGGLATASKSLADLVVAVKDGSKKSQIEAAKSHIDLAKVQMERSLGSGMNFVGNSTRQRTRTVTWR